MAITLRVTVQRFVKFDNVDMNLRVLCGGRLDRVFGSRYTEADAEGGFHYNIGRKARVNF